MNDYALKKLRNISAEESFTKEADEIISKIKKRLYEIKDVQAAVLFGSFARGDFSRRHSDIDIMVFIDKNEKAKKIEEKILRSVNEICLNKSVAAHIIFQYKKVEEEDKSLLLTMAEQGKPLFAKELIVIGKDIVGLKTYNLVKFDTAGLDGITKNKLQRFLHGYTMNKKRYKGLIDEDAVLSAGKAAIIARKDLCDSILLFANKIGVKAQLKGKLFR